MSILSKDELLAAALRLDEMEREALAHELLDSCMTPAERTALDAAQAAESHRRLAELQTNPSLAIPYDKFMESFLRKVAR